MPITDNDLLSQTKSELAHQLSVIEGVLANDNLTHSIPTHLVDWASEHYNSVYTSQEIAEEIARKGIRTPKQSDFQWHSLEGRVLKTEIIERKLEKLEEKKLSAHLAQQEMQQKRELLFLLLGLAEERKEQRAVNAFNEGQDARIQDQEAKIVEQQIKAYDEQIKAYDAMIESLDRQIEEIEQEISQNKDTLNELEKQASSLSKKEDLYQEAFSKTHREDLASILPEELQKQLAQIKQEIEAANDQASLAESQGLEGKEDTLLGLEGLLLQQHIIEEQLQVKEKKLAYFDEKGSTCNDTNHAMHAIRVDKELHQGQDGELQYYKKLAGRRDLEQVRADHQQGHVYLLDENHQITHDFDKAHRFNYVERDCVIKQQEDGQYQVVNGEGNQVALSQYANEHAKARYLKKCEDGSILSHQYSASQGLQQSMQAVQSLIASVIERITSLENKQVGLKQQHSSCKANREACVTARKALFQEPSKTSQNVASVTPVVLSPVKEPKKEQKNEAESSPRFNG